jgi:hypothetical protein
MWQALLDYCQIVFSCLLREIQIKWVSFPRFGSIFNLAKLIVDDFRGGFENGPWWQRIFNGYTITTWLVVLNLGSTGLLVSWLMKHADNIVKVYLSTLFPLVFFHTSYIWWILYVKFLFHRIIFFLKVNN